MAHRSNSQTRSASIVVSALRSSFAREFIMRDHANGFSRRAIKFQLVAWFVLLMIGAAAIADELPAVSDRAPVPAPHFPDAAHAAVWRNWQLVEPERLAAVLGTTAEKITELATSMGLPRQVDIPREMRERGYITLV